MVDENMNSSTTVSFVIPCYNSAKTIDRCLQSICALDCPANASIEIVVIDNGSSDKTLDIVRQFTEQIIVDTTATIAKLRNLGSLHASGAIIACVDSDCYLPIDWLHCALSHLEDEQTAVVGTKTYTLPEDATWVERAWKRHLDRSSTVVETSWVPSLSFAVKREAFEQVGGFDESLVACEDVALGHAIRKHFRIVADPRLAPMHAKNPKTLVELYKKEIWRAHNSSSTSLMNLDKPKEVLSLLLPFYYLVFLVLFPLAAVLSIVTTNYCFFLVVLLAIILPLAGISFDTCRRIGSFKIVFQLFAVYSAYVLAKVRVLFLKS